MAILKQVAAGMDAQGLRGGEGRAKIFSVPLPEEATGPIRMSARIELEPGASIGYHIHEDDEETYAILSGHGVFKGDDGEIPAYPGDIFVTRVGHGHSLRNNGSIPLVFFAVVAKG